MDARRVAATIALLALLPSASHGGPARGPRVLVLSGSNNHDWRATTPVLVSILERGGCDPRVTERVAELRPDAFEGVDVVLSNFNVFGLEHPGPVWSAAVRAAFSAFIERGGGYVGVHAGGSVFDDWPEFKRVAGAWWGAPTSHGAVHDAEVSFDAAPHPITTGLAPFRTTDEFWQGAVLSPGAKVLAWVVPDPTHGGSGRPEPVLVTTAAGKGRGVAVLLGHDARAMRNPGFERLLARAVQWAGGGAPSSSAFQEK